MTAVSLATAGDPHDSWDWSGISSALYRSLGELGHGPTWIDARPAHDGRSNPARRAVLLAQLPAALRYATDEPLIVRMSRFAEISRLNAQLLGTLVSVRRRRSDAPRQAVQLRGDFAPARGMSSVIYEDITVAQVAECGYWVFAAPTPDRLARRRIAHQRSAHLRATASGATTQWVADALVDDYGVPRERVHLVGLGAEALTEGGPRDWTRPRLLWIGLDWQRKGGDALVRAFGRLREDHPDAELHLAGSHPAVDAPGVVGHGRLDRTDARQRAELEGLFATSTCFVMPSQMEPGGIVHAEAGLAGLPSIGSATGGVRTTIGPGGYVVVPGDRAQLEAALRKVADPAVAQGLGAAARRHAEQLTWPRVAERLVRALDPALADRLGYVGFLRTEPAADLRA